MQIRRLITDYVTIRDADNAEIAQRVPATFNAKGIILWDTRIKLEPSYYIVRTIPNGMVEEYIVDEPGFTHAVGRSVPSRYVVKCHRRGAQKPGSQINYNVSGANARINIGSYDASQNLIYHSGTPEELFESIQSALETIVGVDREELLAGLTSMKASLGQPSFGERYQDFIA